jgi:hypothetical protein
LLRSQRGGLLLINQPLPLDGAALSDIGLIQSAALIEPALPDAAARPRYLPRAWQTGLRDGGTRRRSLKR